jgi:hypothetical protein
MLGGDDIVLWPEIYPLRPAACPHRRVRWTFGFPMLPVTSGAMCADCGTRWGHHEIPDQVRSSLAR